MNKTSPALLVSILLGVFLLEIHGAPLLAVQDEHFQFNLDVGTAYTDNLFLEPSPSMRRDYATVARFRGRFEPDSAGTWWHELKYRFRLYDWHLDHQASSWDHDLKWNAFKRFSHRFSGLVKNYTCWNQARFEADSYVNNRTDAGFMFRTGQDTYGGLFYWHELRHFRRNNSRERSSDAGELLFRWALSGNRGFEFAYDYELRQYKYLLAGANRRRDVIDRFRVSYSQVFNFDTTAKIELWYRFFNSNDTYWEYDNPRLTMFIWHELRRQQLITLYGYLESRYYPNRAVTGSAKKQKDLVLYAATKFRHRLGLDTYLEALYTFLKDNSNSDPFDYTHNKYELRFGVEF